MISRLMGTLVEVGEQYALVENRGVFYEVLVPSGLAERLKSNGGIGGTIRFETLYYIEAGERKSSHYPRLVGFTDPVDREFFSLLIRVPGLGVRKALKSLVMPIREIAAAIETKNAASLNRLPGVGGRLAEKIIAELHGKTAKFALSRSEEALAAPSAAPVSFADEAREVLIQLQYKQSEADELIRAALGADPAIESVEKLISIIFRNEQKAKTAAQ